MVNRSEEHDGEPWRATNRASQLIEEVCEIAISRHSLQWHWSRELARLSLFQIHDGVVMSKVGCKEQGNNGDCSERELTNSRG